VYIEQNFRTEIKKYSPLILSNSKYSNTKCDILNFSKKNHLPGEKSSLSYLESYRGGLLLATLIELLTGNVSVDPKGSIAVLLEMVLGGTDGLFVSLKKIEQSVFIRLKNLSVDSTATPFAPKASPVSRSKHEIWTYSYKFKLVLHKTWLPKYWQALIM